MSKILFFNFNALWCPFFDTEVELMSDYIEKNDTVYSVACFGELEGNCVSSEMGKLDYCKKCIMTLNNAYDTLKFPLKRIIPLKKYPKKEYPVFNSIDELKRYEVDSINIGFGVASSYMYFTREYNYNPIECKEEIDKLLNTAELVARNVKRIIQKIKPDKVCIFNGRFAEYYPIMDYCIKNNINYFVHERGCDKNHYLLIENSVLHDLKRIKKAIQTQWDSELDNERKEKLSIEWFEDMRNRVEHSFESYVDKQTKSKLPDNFDTSKENIAIFNSSMDEYACFDDWKSVLDKSENDIIRNIAEHYKNDSSKHFYVRVHPNLKDLKTTQIQELNAIKKANYKNLTIIDADKDIDTYALLDACDKCLNFMSTMGVEATYWNKPSILAGSAFYEDLDVVYKVNSYDELFKVIDDKKLKPKPKKNTYPYGYYMMTHGIEFKKFQAHELYFGLFATKNLRAEKNKIHHKLKRFIRKTKSVIVQI